MKDVTEVSNSTTLEDVTEETETAEATEEKSLEERYREMVHELMCRNGWSRRKAIRYLQSKATKATKKLIKEGKARQEKLRREGKLVDTSDLREQLEREQAEELQKQVQPNPEALKQAQEYLPPTRDF